VVIANLTEFWRPGYQWTVGDAESIVVIDRGQAFRPGNGSFNGAKHVTPFDARFSESLMAPDEPLSYPTDISALACSIQQFLGSEDSTFAPYAVRGKILIDHAITLHLEVLRTNDSL
jgi:hypothetical protein